MVWIYLGNKNGREGGRKLKKKKKGVDHEIL